MNPHPNPKTDILSTPFLKELARQIRAQDNTGLYQTHSNESLLQTLILSQSTSNIRGNEDKIAQQRIANFYQAIAARLEQETGQLAQTFINVNPQKPGWVHIFCGRLLVLSKMLRDVHSFGFDSLEKLATEGEKLTQVAIELAQDYFEIPALTTTNLQQS
ncbi:MAG TPA: hypothetical protein DDZ80_25450 [Cyanobacteria bacterium UBA8803]|nr:hypothetical protein [Cyanobacteria bacterium UBA9273]HBL61641.1 hypothetical protein [Cyanobacteria bacterium UBA8803]